MTLEFENAYNCYAALIYRIGILYFAEKTAAEDLVQDCFLKLFETKREFSNEEHLKAWLITVAKNKCNNIFKRNKRITLLDENIAYTDTSKYVLEEIYKLKAQDRLVVYLHYYEGYTSHEIAKLTKCSDAAVRARMSRARTQLKQILEENNEKI